MRRMRLVGLTGGIASGKSTVAGMLRAERIPVIDADQLAREVVAPGTPGLEAVRARFPGVVASDGTLDRAKLGAHVFQHPDERRALEGITHPLIRDAAMKRFSQLSDEGYAVAAYDVPLLFENGLEAICAGVLVVWVPREVQVARLIERDGLTPEAAELRLQAQMSLDEKKRRATWVIDNSGSLEQTRAQVLQVIDAIRAAGAPGATTR